jgi:hypothetical protein
MAKMRYITNDIGPQRKIAVEIFKIDAGFPVNFQVTMHLAKYQLAFGETMEETVEMNTREVIYTKATIEITGKIAGQGTKDLFCLPKR